MTIAPSIEYSQLEQTVSKVLRHVNVKISEEGTELCHDFNKKAMSQFRIFRKESLWTRYVR